MISVVVPIYNEEENIPPFHAAVATVMVRLQRVLRLLARLLWLVAIAACGPSNAEVKTAKTSAYNASIDDMIEVAKQAISEDYKVGVVNQRYYVILDGNAQELQVISNQERIRATTPFKWVAHAWYHLKTRVDVALDGSGVVRAKAWKRGDPEPEKWTLEVPHKQAHANGAPGLFGFALQSMFRVYIDNISVKSNA